MIRKRRKENIMESVKNCREEEIYKFSQQPIEFKTKMFSVLSFALNANKNMMVLHCRLNPFSTLQPLSNSCCSIYTLEGCHVTSFRSDKYYETLNLEKFTEDSIISGKLLNLDYHIGDEHCTSITLTRYNDYGIKCIVSILCEELECRTIFIDCDKIGNIYTNAAKTNEIAIYNSDLVFQRTLEYSGIIQEEIVSVNIKDGIIILLAICVRLKCIDNNNYSHVMYKFSLSTEEHIATIGFCDRVFSNENCISFDNCCNILIFYWNSSTWTSPRTTIMRNTKRTQGNVWLYCCDGRISCYTLLTGTKEHHIRYFPVGMAITDDYQMVIIMNNGVFLIYNAI